MNTIKSVINLSLTDPSASRTGPNPKKVTPTKSTKNRT